MKTIVIKDMQHSWGEKQTCTPPDLFLTVSGGKVGGNNTALGGRHKESYIPNSSNIFSLISCPRGAVLHVFVITTPKGNLISHQE